MDFDAEIKKQEARIAELKQQKQLAELQTKYVIISNFRTEKNVYNPDPHAYADETQCYLNTPKVYADHKGAFPLYNPQAITILNDPTVNLKPDDFLFTRSEAETFAKRAKIPALVEAGIVRADHFSQHQYFTKKD